MPYAVAMSCDAQASGGATWICTAPRSWWLPASSGWGAPAPSGTTSFSTDSQRVNLTGGGFCGWNTLAHLFNPFNGRGGSLQLQFQPCFDQGPRLVVNGSTEMALECAPGTYTDPGAQAFDGCGNPIPVHAFNTGTDSSGPGPNPGAEGTYSVSYVRGTSPGGR